MIGHKSAVGQLVEFAMAASPAPKRIGPYEVLRALPADNVRLRAYRIESKAVPFERSGKGYDIVARGDISDQPQVQRTQR